MYHPGISWLTLKSVAWLKLVLFALKSLMIEELTDKNFLRRVGKLAHFSWKQILKQITVIFK